MMRRIAQVTALSATICNEKEETAVETAMIPSGQKPLQGSPGSPQKLISVKRTTI